METIARYLPELFIRPEVDTTAVDDRASKEHITDNDNGISKHWRLDIKIPVSSFLFKNAFKIGSKEEVGSNALVKQSCNGLLLCYVSPDHKYYVYNPTVKMFNMIPQPIKTNVNPRFRCRMIIGFDPTKSPHYKVVYATSIGDDDDDVVVSIQIQTYSSETRSWSAVSSDPLFEKSLVFHVSEYGKILE
ncbi:SGNH hydrolase-type esterase domain-containing protein [Tanacetum coccineum]